MEIALKQRLMGAAVIIAIAVIVLPLLLDGSGEHVVSEIPPRMIPDFPEQGVVMDEDMPPLPIRQKPPVVDALVAADSQVATGTTSTRTVTTAEVIAPTEVITSARSTVPSEGTGQKGEVGKVVEKRVVAREVPNELQAWVVQIGSFAEEDKADALRDRMRVAGFKAFVEYSKDQPKPMYRVRVGPHLERGHAEQTLSQLQEKAGIKGYITHHP